jgi:hypothetical protein
MINLCRETARLGLIITLLGTALTTINAAEEPWKVNDGTISFILGARIRNFTNLTDSIDFTVVNTASVTLEVKVGFNRERHPYDQTQVYRLAPQEKVAVTTQVYKGFSPAIGVYYRRPRF